MPARLPGAPAGDPAPHRRWAPVAPRVCVRSDRAARWPASCDPPPPRPPRGALRRLEQVRCQMPWCIWNTAAPRDAAHVDDERLPAAFDDVDAEEVDAEGPAAAQGDVAQLGGGRERLSAPFLVGPCGEHLLHPEQLAPDDVDLAVTTLGRVVALGEHRVAAVTHRRELGDAADYAYADAV